MVMQDSGHQQLGSERGWGWVLSAARQCQVSPGQEGAHFLTDESDEELGERGLSGAGPYYQLGVS